LYIIKLLKTKNLFTFDIGFYVIPCEDWQQGQLETTTRKTVAARLERRSSNFWIFVLSWPGRRPL